MISPHTTAPTANAAIHEPCHRVRVTLPCVVIRFGMASRVKAFEVQPARLVSATVRSAARAINRRRVIGRPRRGGSRVRLTMRNSTGPAGSSFGGSRLSGGSGGHPRAGAAGALTGVTCQANVRVVAYLDAASSEPLHPAARAALLTALDDGWADPARLYGDGRRARLLRPPRTGPGQTGPGQTRPGPAVVASAVEHSSVLHAIGHCERDGAEAT